MCYLNKGRILSSPELLISRYNDSISKFTILFAIILAVFLKNPALLEAGVKQNNQVEREESSTSSDFSFYRERSVQSLIYSHTTPFLQNEFNFRHVSYQFIPSPWFFIPPPEQNITANQLWQASIYGRNLASPLEFKVGRVWAGNETFRSVDGGTLNYKWGNRLSTNFLVGKASKIDETIVKKLPELYEEQLRYKFNENAFFTVGGGQKDEVTHSLAQLGFSMDSFRFLGEHRSVTGASETWGLNVRYFTPGKLDLVGDYRLETQGTQESGSLRSLIGYDAGKIYIEGATGLVYHQGQIRSDNMAYYEGNLTWGQPDFGLDGITLGYLLEHGLASTARTISGSAEKRVSSKTRIYIDLSDTIFEQNGESIQNLGSRLHRKVDWGYYELDLAFITGSRIESLQKEAKIRAGMEF
ncbi:MAG: hypothetical protein HQM08_22910 [Candidatus Riflebacteria bacterium]|nr:hypothetical protein [Candidatus Riflebacteria bacterium]